MEVQRAEEILPQEVLYPRFRKSLVNIEIWIELKSVVEAIAVAPALLSSADRLLERCRLAVAGSVFTIC